MGSSAALQKIFMVAFLRFLERNAISTTQIKSCSRARRRAKRPPIPALAPVINAVLLIE